MGAPGEAQARSRAALSQALKGAAFTALITLGLAFPIIALRTEQDQLNNLILIERWGLVGGLVAAAFVGRLAWSLYGGRLPALRPGALPFAARLSWRREVLARVAVAFVIAYPFLAVAVASLGGPGALKLIDNYGIQILIYVVLGLGLNIVVGLTGLLDLGYVAFYAVGAYSSALLAKTFGLSFWLVLPLAGMLAALWGLIIGLPVLRLKGDYLAIVTLAFAEIVRLVLINWVPLTGGYAGISNIPKPTLLGMPLGPEPGGLAVILGLPPSPLYRLVFMYYLVLGLAVMANWVTTRLRALPVGRAWEAMREDEIACRSLGINAVTTKLTAFSTGAFFGGIAGAFFAAHQGFISPKSFEFMESAIIVAIVVLGGLGSQTGVAIAAIVMIGGTELLRELNVLKALFGADFDPAQYRMLIFGLAMVVLMIWRPRGLIARRTASIRLVGQGRAAAARE